MVRKLINENWLVSSQNMTFIPGNMWKIRTSLVNIRLNKLKINASLCSLTTYQQDYQYNETQIHGSLLSMMINQQPMQTTTKGSGLYDMCSFISVLLINIDPTVAPTDSFSFYPSDMNTSKKLQKNLQEVAFPQLHIDMPHLHACVILSALAHRPHGFVSDGLQPIKRPHAR